MYTQLLTVARCLAKYSLREREPPVAFTIENPRFLPGNISGAGMEHTPNGRIVDTRHAVVLDFIDGCLIEHPNPGNPMYALALAGTVNGTEDRARCVYLIPAEGAGVLIDRIVNLAGMIGPDFTQQLINRVSQLQPSPADPELHTEPPIRAEAPAPAAEEAPTDKKVA